MTTRSAVDLDAYFHRIGYPGAEAETPDLETVLERVGGLSGARVSPS